MLPGILLGLGIVCVNNKQFLFHGAVTPEVQSSPPTSSGYSCQDIDTGRSSRVTCAKLHPSSDSEGGMPSHLECGLTRNTGIHAVLESGSPQDESLE